jgi:hypothetical protein
MAIEVLERRAVLADDFRVHDLVCHELILLTSC